jgi:hypothetical protein
VAGENCRRTVLNPEPVAHSPPAVAWTPPRPKLESELLPDGQAKARQQLVPAGSREPGTPEEIRELRRGVIAREPGVGPAGQRLCKVVVPGRSGVHDAVDSTFPQRGRDGFAHRTRVRVMVVCEAAEHQVELPAKAGRRSRGVGLHERDVQEALVARQAMGLPKHASREIDPKHLALRNEGGDLSQLAPWTASGIQYACGRIDPLPHDGQRFVEDRNREKRDEVSVLIAHAIEFVRLFFTSACRIVQYWVRMTRRKGRAETGAGRRDGRLADGRRDDRDSGKLARQRRIEDTRRVRVHRPEENRVGQASGIGVHRAGIVAGTAHAVKSRDQLSTDVHAWEARHATGSRVASV